MLDIVCAVNDETILSSNLLRSAVLDTPGVRLHVQRGFSSASLAYRDAMGRGSAELIVLVHQDVYLPQQWLAQLRNAVGYLSRSDPEWAVLGIYGLRADGHHAGCVWSSGLDSIFGRAFEVPVRAVSIDEVLIVVRRSSGVEFDAWLPGYHLYGTDIVQTALSRGRGAYIAFAPVVHNSRPCHYLGRDYFFAHRYVARKWRSRLPIPNNVAPIIGPGPAYWTLRVRHRINEWRYSRIDRASLDRRYDCVGVARRLGFE